jgi:hypothetical protein
VAFTRSEINRRFRERHPERVKQSYKDWAQDNRPNRNEYMRGWWARAKKNDPEKYALMARRSRLKRRYGISLEDYEQLLTKQGGHCALCERTPEHERHGFLAVDHCHETGRVRGLLCEQHNLALGKMGDTESSIRKVLSYLTGI